MIAIETVCYISVKGESAVAKKQHLHVFRCYRDKAIKFCDCAFNEKNCTDRLSIQKRNVITRTASY